MRIQSWFQPAVPLAFALMLVACNNPSGSAIKSGAIHLAGAVASPPDAARSDPAATNFISTKVMLRGYCYAGSPVDTDAPGGFGPCDNDARAVAGSCSGKGLYLLAQPNVVATFGKEPGMRLALVNRTRETLAFQASDSRLPIIQEAIDPHGSWKPIEYLPQSDCGNSHHRVFLSPGAFWAFPAPRYNGAVKTQLRFTLTLADGSLLHSNVFEGSVNPEQFSEKQGNVATEIMDPYRE